MLPHELAVTGELVARTPVTASSYGIIHFWHFDTSIIFSLHAMVPLPMQPGVLVTNSPVMIYIEIT